MTDRPNSQHLYDSLTRLGHRIADQARFFTDSEYREEVFLARARQVCRDNWEKISREICESREMTHFLWRYAQGETLSPDEMEAMKQQILDLVRVVPALGIFALPGGMILLPLLAKAFPWGLVPSAWRQKRGDSEPSKAKATATVPAAPSTASASGRRLGVVIAQHGRHSRVDDGASCFECVWRGKLHRESRAKPVVVGDRVEFTVTAPGTGIIESVLPRRTRLSRKRKDGRSSEHVLVANLDRVALVTSAKDPPFDRTMVERVVVAANVAGLAPLLVVNKMDLGDLHDLEPFLASLEKHGIEVVRISALTGRGLDRLAGALAGRTTALCGPSGVGKSTLVNRLCPDAAQRTGEIIAKSRLGRHTTSDVSLLPLPSGGHIVDMPGIREFGLWDVSREDVLRFFSEFEPFADECRFRGCTHDHEPDCRVKEAVSKGEIDPERHASYVRLLRSL
ncbi:MAG: ribosome small subunit-dependent GTPase A [Planctomycetes bacterium]|nr:ribosome small subunit-dependent GTPase A [Planctomycetota bacterium]